MALLSIFFVTLYLWRKTASETVPSDFYINFLQALANDSPTRWHSIAAFVDVNPENEWVYHVNLPKMIYSLNSLSDTLQEGTTVNCYLIAVSSENWRETQSSLASSIREKRLDANKPFFVFTDSMNWNAELRENFDVTIIRKVRHWDTKTNSFKLESLMFQRHRLLSKIKPEEMIGYYYGTENLGESAKKILFDQSFSFHNRNVKVSAFSIPPTTVRCQNDPSTFCGRDAKLIHTLSDKLSFTPEFVVPPAMSKWGDKLSNGTWTGLIGDVSRGTTTLGVANIFTTSHYIEQLDMSYPYDFSCSTFLTPPLQPLSQWITLIKPFRLSLWMATIFSIFIGGLLIQWSSMLYQWLFKRSIRNRLVVFGEAMMYNAQCITGVRAGSDELPAWPIRIYNSNWWLFCFLIGTVYRTGLTSWVASSPIFMSPVDTIAQLVKSELIPYGYNTFIRDIAQYSSDPLTIELGKRQQLVPVNVSVKTLMGEDYARAFYENKNYLEYLAATVVPPTFAQTGNSTRVLMNPKRRFHVMRECFRTFPVAIAMTRGSIFKETTTDTIHRLNGAGLLKFWLDSVIHGSAAHADLNSASDERVYAPFSMYHLEGVFYLLLLCYLIVLVVFLGEIMFHRLIRSNIFTRNV